MMRTDTYHPAVKWSSSGRMIEIVQQLTSPSLPCAMLPLSFAPSRHAASSDAAAGRRLPGVSGDGALHFSAALWLRTGSAARNCKGSLSGRARRHWSVKTFQHPGAGHQPTRPARAARCVRHDRQCGDSGTLPQDQPQFAAPCLIAAPSPPRPARPEQVVG